MARPWRQSLSVVFLFLLLGPARAETGEAFLAHEMANAIRLAGSQMKVPRAKKPPVQLAEPDAEGGRTLNVRAYAYCLRGRTASGRYTKHGIIAVDPRLIPLGSRMYVPGYGWGIAADTGGAIRGHKIDLWMPTSGHCYRWGVRSVKIKVFPPR